MINFLLKNYANKLFTQKFKYKKKLNKLRTIFKIKEKILQFLYVNN